MRHHKKSIRIFSDLKNVTNAASQKTYPNFFGLEKCHNNRRQYPVQGGYNKKSYPKCFGLEKCHE